MRVSWPILGLLAAVLQATDPAPTLAADLRLAQAEDLRPLAAILSTIKARIPGRALDAKRSQQNGEVVYRVKWLGEDGQVREILVDARSGKILNIR